MNKKHKSYIRSNTKKSYTIHYEITQSYEFVYYLPQSLRAHSTQLLDKALKLRNTTYAKEVESKIFGDTTPATQ